MIPTRLHFAKWLLAACAIIQGGCFEVIAGGNDDDHEVDGGSAFSPQLGIYATTEHWLSELECDQIGASVSDGPGYFEIYQDQVSGHPFLFVTSCADSSDCDDATFGGFFLRPNSAASWSGQSYAAWRLSTCMLYQLTSELTPTASGVRVAMWTRILEVDLPEESCTVEAAEERADDMSCRDYRVVEGEPL